MSFDPHKPCTTRDGRPARIICTDAKCPCDNPIVALITEGGKEFPQYFYATGRVRAEGENSLDLVNIPEKIEGWVNVYPTQERHLVASLTDIFPDLRHAHEAKRPGRIACIKLTFSEGDGL